MNGATLDSTEQRGNQLLVRNHSLVNGEDGGVLPKETGQAGLEGRPSTVGRESFSCQQGPRVKFLKTNISNYICARCAALVHRRVGLSVKLAVSRSR